MKINKKSWHYKIWNFLKDPKEPKLDTCSYFGHVFFGLFLMIVIFSWWALMFGLLVEKFWFKGTPTFDLPELLSYIILGTPVMFLNIMVVLVLRKVLPSIKKKLCKPIEFEDKQ